MSLRLADSGFQYAIARAVEDRNQEFKSARADVREMEGSLERGRARPLPKRQNQNLPRIAYAERRVKPLARLLRCATALRVTAPHGCGSRRLVWPKGSLSARPNGPNSQVCGAMLSNAIK